MYFCSIIGSAMKKAFTAFILASLTSTSAYAQFTSLGDYPCTIKWNTVNTQDYRIVYPQGTDSLATVYGTQLQKWRIPVSRSAGFLPNGNYRKSMPVILHPFSSYANGAVVWAPRRMELFTLADPVDPIAAMPWEQMLGIHENRHVAQLQAGRNGWFWKGLSYVTGELSAASVNSIFMEPALSEGDAVVAETGLTCSGRGRTASFLNYYRMALDTLGKRNWYQWRYGSVRRPTPDYYRVGYMTVAGARYLYDNPLFMADYLDKLKNPLRINAFRKTLRKTSGKKFNQAWDEIQDTFHNIWKEEDRLRGPFQETLAETKGNGRVYTSYGNAVGDGERIYAVKSSMNRAPVLVSVENGKENKLIPFSRDAGKIDICGSLLTWSEPRAGSRFGLKGSSRIRIMSLSTKKVEDITGRRHRYFNPSFDEEGRSIAVIEHPAEGGTFLVIIDAMDGHVLNRWKAPEGVRLTEALFYGDRMIAAGISEGGTGLYSISGDGSWEPLLEESPVLLRDLRRNGDVILCSSDLGGIDEIYSFNPSDRSLLRITNTRYGARCPIVTDDGLRFIAMTPSGELVSSAAGDFAMEADFSSPHVYPIAETLSRQETELSAGEDKPVISAVSGYDNVMNFFHFHSWVPFYVESGSFQNLSSDFNLQAGSIGATAFFQNLTGTGSGSFGISVSPEPYGNGKWMPGGHFRMRYAGFGPVLDLALDIGDRHRGMYQYGLYTDIDGTSTLKLSLKNKDLEYYSGDLPYVSASLTLSLPLVWEYDGWQHDVEPYLSVTYNNDIYYSPYFAYRETYSGEYVPDNERMPYQRNYAVTPFINAGVRGSRMRPVATSRIWPETGVGFELRAGWSLPATKFYGKIYGYIPGVAGSDGFKLSLDALCSTKDFAIWSPINIDMSPRGLAGGPVPVELRLLAPTTVRASLDYAAPAIPTDWAMGQYFYLRDIEIIPFADLTFAMLSAKVNGAWWGTLFSAGTDIVANFQKFLMVRNTVRPGIRVAYNGGSLLEGFQEIKTNRDRMYIGAVFKVDF